MKASHSASRRSVGYLVGIPGRGSILLIDVVDDAAVGSPTGSPSRANSTPLSRGAGEHDGPALGESPVRDDRDGRCDDWYRRLIHNPWLPSITTHIKNSTNPTNYSATPS
ncbi:hypothetical protein [Haloarcula sp. JP-L23]|uniref:hypothetical protein n=1 Tax=Haloarcula sp. JP-L23 TaxID=2716717 RepID=UPI00140F3D4E|nr:hypothetical protein G9465_19975 [Haloarcula sp. JP-L23]